MYLNGELDDGFLLGAVSGSQRSSREATFIGRGAGFEEFTFAGAVDEVRIYSLALTAPGIAAVMAGKVVDTRSARPASEPVVQGSRNLAHPPDREALCAASNYEDARIPATAAAVGVLLALACVGLWLSTGPLFCLAASLAAGWLLHLATAASLPPPNMWIIPLTSLLEERRSWLPAAVRQIDRRDARWRSWSSRNRSFLHKNGSGLVGSPSERSG